MRKSELRQLLDRIPGDPEVLVWLNETPHGCSGCDGAIEQSVECDNLRGERVLVLGLDIPVSELQGAELVWSES